MTADPVPSAARLQADPRVEEARRRIVEDDARTLEVQVELTEIPAPPFGEEARGRRMAELLDAAGAERVRRDAVGNVLSVIAAHAPGPPLVVSAHLDTVFPEGTEVSVRRESDRWVGPGISDDGRGLAALWALVRALVAARVPLAAPVWIVATVGEEGPGDLRGVKHLFGTGGEARGARGFVSLDGAGLARLVTRGLGVRRLRLTVRGPGGHSWVDRSTPNPIHALGAAVAEMARIPLASNPPVGLTVARWGGGTSINAIPREAWVELDLRSESGNYLRDLEEQVRKVAAGTVGSSNAAGDGSAPLTLTVDVIGDRPPGATDPDDPLVSAAVQATRAVGLSPDLVASSTDANLPMSLGIPAVTMGAGGEAGQAHTPDEWYRNEKGPDGVVRALLTVLLAVGVEGG